MSKTAGAKDKSGPSKRTNSHKYSELELEDVDASTIKRVLKKT